MDYIISYDIAGIIFLFFLYLVTSYFNKAPTRTNRLYKVFIFYSFLGAFLDVFTVFTNHYTDTTLMLVVNNLLAVIHIFAVNMVPLMYFLFILSLTHNQKKFGLRQRIFTTALLLYDVIAIGTSPFTHYVMFYDEFGKYSHGIGMAIQYVTIIAFIIAGVVELIINRKNVSLQQMLIVLSYTVIDIAATVYQFLHPSVLLLGLASAVSLMLISFALKNPMELIDSDIGIYNRAAFKEVYFSKRSNYIAVLAHITNSDSIKYMHGTDNGYFLIRQCVKKVLKECGDPLAFYLFQDTFLMIAKNEKEASQIIEAVKRHRETPVYILPKPDAKTESPAYIEADLFLMKDMNVFKFDDEKLEGLNEVDVLLNIFQFIVDTYVAGSDVREIDGKVVEDFKQKLVIQSTVDEAIKNESFEVFMQPIYDLNKKCFTGAESLIRLRDSNGKFISPGLFIPEAEKNGKILALGDISIKKTCEFICKGELAKLGITKVNINLSMVQCMQDNIVEHIIEILDEYKVPKEMIRFEITETIMATNPDILNYVMTSLSSYGIEFALDDYGTGYSNTSRLLNFPFSEIKFDKSFVDSAMEDKKHTLPLKHLMNMVSDSNMIVLVEGVETKEMSQLIEDFGGNLIQGFYYAKPLPLEDFVAFINEKRSF